MSENIAYQQMIGDAKEISFVDSGLLSISWKYHYGTLFDELISKMGIEYEYAVYDKSAVQELRSEIGKCFAIDFNFAIEQIIQIQTHFNPDQPEIQTIEPYVLPFNLVADSGTTEENARLFYNGLSLSRDNVLSIEDSVYKANSLERYLFRPILIYRINGVERALIGVEKINEAFHVIATNAVQFNAFPYEWSQNVCLKSYMDKKGHEHDKLYEDEIERRIQRLGLLYCRNVKSLKQENGNQIKITTPEVGEIDFLIVNRDLQTVFVGESKYNRSRYEGVGYRMDYTNFINNYEKKLLRKTSWITSNLTIVQQHFRKLYTNAEINLTGFNIVGVFFLNTPTFYSFNGSFKAITLFHFDDFVTGNFDMPQLFLPVRYEGKAATLLSTHPYFKPENLQIRIDEN